VSTSFSENVQGLAILYGVRQEKWMSFSAKAVGRTAKSNPSHLRASDVDKCGSCTREGFRIWFEGFVFRFLLSVNLVVAGSSHGVIAITINEYFGRILLKCTYAGSEMMDLFCWIRPSRTYQARPVNQIRVPVIRPRLTGQPVKLKRQKLHVFVLLISAVFIVSIKMECNFCGRS
jgi:hypothetical protein